MSGMGMNSMLYVPCERDTGKMRIDKLEEMVKREIEAGNKPFYVNSTAGTTVIGSYDDFNAVADVCQKYDLWFHIDASWGGYLAFADKYKDRGLFEGAERADSLNVNPHKGLGVPIQCSMLLVNNKPDLLRKTFMSGAEYLFLDTEFSKYDLADKTMQCGRRPDGLKLWLSLKKHGKEGCVRIANEAMDKAVYLAEQVRKQPDKFVLVHEAQATNVGFWYVPPAFRGKEYTDKQKVGVHKLIFNRMNELGTVIIQHQPVPEFDIPNFFRVTLKGEKTRLSDMDFFLEEIDRLGQDIDDTMV